MSVGPGQPYLVFGLAALLLTITACEDDSATPTLTQIVVVVDSDILVPDKLDGIKISVTGTVKSSIVEDKLDAEHPLPRSLGVVHSGGPLGPLRVTATGMHGGDTVTERVANVYFVKDRTLKLALPLAQSCAVADLNCASDETCDRGVCIASTLMKLPAFSGDDGPLDPVDWAQPVTDAGRDSSVDAMTPTDAAEDAAAGGGGSDAAPQPLVSCSTQMPETGDSFYVGDEITFEGRCTNVDGGEIAARWSSDLDGTLGERASFTKDDLSVGVHEISLCTDAKGKDKACAVTLTIEVKELPEISAEITSLAQAGKTEGVYSGDAELVAKGTGNGVPPLKYRWIDSFAGEIGTADTAHYVAPMLAGRHSVRLIVTDKRNRTAKADGTFEVHEAAHDTLFEPYTALNNVLAGTQGNSINAIASDGDYHYVGTTKGWLLSISAEGSPETNATTIAMVSPGASMPMSLPSVRDVYLRSGTLYLATDRDVQSCTVNESNVTACTVLALPGLSGSSVPRSVRVVNSADTDYLIVGTSLGLWTGSVKALAMGGLRENNTVFSGSTESAGSLWIAASAGLYTYSLASAGAMSLMNNPKKIDNGPSGLSSLVSSAGVIWASLSEGIACYDAGGKSWNMWTTNYDAALFGRLVSNDVRTIAITHPIIKGVTHNVIWIGTGSGLSRFDPAIPSFTTYTKADGLPDNAVLRAFGLSSNELLLATESGLAIHRGQ